MKKILLFIASIAVFACAKELPVQDVSKENNNKTLEYREITIKTNYSPITSATWVDGEGYAWNAAADANSFALLCNVSEGVAHSTAVSTSTDGSGKQYSTFTVSVPVGATKAFVMYPYGYGGYGYGSNTSSASFWFEIQSTQTQTDAGTLQTLNNRAVLVSPTAIDLTDATEYTAQLSFVTSLARFLVYDSSNSGAHVSSVAITPVTENYFHPQFVTSYNFGTNTLSPYSDQSAVAANSFRVNLTNAYEVGSSRPTSAGAGIYLGIPSCEITGYTITVATNLGNYSFYTASGILSFNQGAIKNIYLDLDRATTKPALLGKTYQLKYPRYSEDLTINVASSAATDWTDFTWYHAQISSDGGANWAEPSASQVVWYQPSWTYVDSDDNPITWISMKYKNESTWLQYTVENNPNPVARVGYAVATYDDVVFETNTYYMDPDQKIKRIRINQPANASAPTIVSVTPSPAAFSGSDSDPKTITVTTTNTSSITVTNPTGDYSYFEVGTPTGSANTFTFTITPSAAGVEPRAASFTITAIDGDASTTDATMTLNVTQAAAGASLTYIFESATAANPSGSTWGISYNQPVTGRYIDIRNISRVDGNPIDYALERDAIIAEAISITDSYGDPLDPEVLSFPYNFMDGTTICCGFKSGSTAVSGAIVTWYNSNGSSLTEAGHWTINIP